MKHLVLVVVLAAFSTTAFAEGTSSEFDGSIDLKANNTSGWSVLHPDRANTIDIGLTQAGFLHITAAAPPLVPATNAWFQNNYTALVYKEVTGNFVVVSKLRVVGTGDTTQPPQGDFNAGGFVVRDPAGNHTGNTENWVMYNFGSQGATGYSREVKKTQGSVSNLFLTHQATLEDYLMVCRVGADFYFFNWDEVGNSWREEAYYNAVNVDGQVVSTSRSSSGVTPEIIDPAMSESTPISFNRPGMGNTLQVGLMAGAWSAPHDVYALFDYIRFSVSPPQTKEDCTAAFPNLGLDPKSKPKPKSMPWLMLLLDD